MSDKLLKKLRDQEQKPYDVDPLAWIILLNIVALHADTRPGGQSGLRARCRECGFAYPCPTIDMIEKEMK